ncbi:hypothetical protein EMCG_09092 [[Emmonsia] crescens]|uniref:Uncharacterized protein n=1 Tax=[Emmonsia] crescens TaxID=73230 RepID=A0A0G2I2Z9_9EURO|nr:hypothetical protein EMCG_09092 [Emmonsia crescens UAMH 3008]
MLIYDEMDNAVPTSIFKEQELDDIHHGKRFSVEFIVQPPEKIREKDPFENPMVVKVRNLGSKRSWYQMKIQIHVKVFHAAGSDRFEVCRRVGRHDEGGVYTTQRAIYSQTSWFLTVPLATQEKNFQVPFGRFYKKGKYVIYVILALGPTDISPRTTREAWTKSNPITVMPYESVNQE